VGSSEWGEAKLPKSTSLHGNTSHDIEITKTGVLLEAWNDPKNKEKKQKKVTGKKSHVTRRIFAETTHVVTALHVSSYL